MDEVGCVGVAVSASKEINSDWPLVDNPPSGQ